MYLSSPLFKSVYTFVTVTLLLGLGITGMKPSEAVDNNGLTVEEDPRLLVLAPSGRAVLEYRYQKVPYKPYIEKLFTPNGVNILRDSPVDHRHHHGLMFAVSVDGVSFWEEHQAPGREQHIRFSTQETGQVGDFSTASFTEQLDWINPRTDQILMVEERKITAYGGKEKDPTLITWECLFSLPPGKATGELTGHHYYGLGMRFLYSMDKGNDFLNADGKTGVDGTNDTKSTWCAYRAAADGHDVTVAMFDHPNNERHPATWFTMNTPFSYLSDTMYLHREPLLLKAGQPLHLRYGVALWDGTIGADQIEKTYRLWLNLLGESQ